MNNQEELIETEYNRAVNLWNETYSECKLVDLKGKPLSVEPMFDICLDIFASKCKKVLDFGCGTGDIIFQCYEFGNTGNDLCDFTKRGGIVCSKIRLDAWCHRTFSCAI